MGSEIEPGEAPFLHTEVKASFPSGTDPLAAIREAMGVFMERTDGTNALEWWQRVRWWHGGAKGMRRGDEVLPPSETGIVPGLNATDKESVYITTDRADALRYAFRHNTPMLFEVTVREEPRFDDVLPTVPTSKRVSSATVYRLEQPSRQEMFSFMAEMEATRRQLAARAAQEDAQSSEDGS